MANIFDKFTLHSRGALKNAFGLALSLGQKPVDPIHILYGISQQKGSVGAEILAKAKFNGLKLKPSLNKFGPINPNINQIDLSALSRKLLEKAVLVASDNKHKYIGTEHILAAIFNISDQHLEKLFKENEIDTRRLTQQVKNILNSTSKFPDLTGAFESFRDHDQADQPASFTAPADTKQPLALDFFAVDLTDRQIQKNIDPVIGREEEINRLIQILSRRHKNNPILLGDPGVGKTAIVEGLAKKITQGEVPEILLDKKIYALDLTLVVAGTSFRGEFENRLKQIILEVKKNPNIILFIDEIHNITGAGSATGSMDAANILKPALARGEIRCIGATTLEDYKKHIESDAALERRFQPIMVDQPDIEKTIAILRGIKNNYELFHQVKITDEAVIAAAQLSERYLAERFLPDKAIDLIDEAASALKIQQGGDQSLQKIIQLESQLYEIQEKKQQKVQSEKFNLALDYKQKEQTLNEELRQLKARRLKQKQKSLGQITKADIAKIIAKITGVPVAELLVAEKRRLLQLERLLNQKIIAQAEATRSVAEFIRRSRTGITDSQRPIGSFMFLGPSGVGKTELAKVLAEQVFGSPQALVRIDMSEFAESFNISKLIGAPAGYVGYKEGTKLTDAVKQRPYSVVLFDEIEKAHPQIFNLLLSILEEGKISDATGRAINFRNTIIVLTSNIGSEEFNRQAAIGFQAKTETDKKSASQNFSSVQREILKKLKNNFRPEFINRLDKIIVFQPLDLKAIIKISQKQLTDLKLRLAKNGLHLEIGPGVAPLIAKKSYAPEVGARAVRKMIQELIETPLAEKLLTKNQKTIKIKVKNNKIVI